MGRRKMVREPRLSAIFGNSNSKNLFQRCTGKIKSDACKKLFIVLLFIILKKEINSDINQ